MVDGAALEKRSPRLAERGFESHPLRQYVNQGLLNLWRGAGVAYQARLESACSLWVTVGSNPTLSASSIFSFSFSSANPLLFINCLQFVSMLEWHCFESE